MEQDNINEGKVYETNDSEKTFCLVFFTLKDLTNFFDQKSTKL